MVFRTKVTNMGGSGASKIEQVAAIDFGTTNSGFAYCLGDGEKIHYHEDGEEWKDGRIMTDILMNSNSEHVIKFGKSALSEYTTRMKMYGDGDTLVTETQNSDNEGDEEILKEKNKTQDVILLDKIKLQLLDLRVGFP